MGTFVRLKKGSRLVIDDDITLDFDDFVHNTAFVITDNGKIITFPSPTKTLIDHAIKITNRGGGNNSLAADFIGGTTTYTLADGGSVIAFITETGTAGTYEWDLIGTGTSVGVSVPVKCTGAEIDTGTDDAKFATPKAIKDSSLSPTKATGAEVDTGTDDDKFVTAKAMEDSTYAKTAAIPVKASGAEINAGVDDAKFATSAAIAASNVALLSDIPDSVAGFTFVKTDTTGGTATDLDNIDYTTLVGSETALVINATDMKAYYYDETSAAAESDPTVIKPDGAGAGTGRWLLLPINLNMIVDIVNANVAAGAAIVESKLSLNYATHATTNDPTTAQKAALVDYQVSGLTAGAGELMAVVTAGSVCPTGSIAHVVTGTGTTAKHSYYVFDKDATTAASSPDIIRPTDYATDGKGNWNLILHDGVDLPYGAAADTVCVGNDARIPTTDQKTALMDYETTSLTGGGAGALDAVVTAGTVTVGGELATSIVGAAPNGTLALYRFEKTGVAAESSPDVIRPDDFATDGQGNWNLVLIAGASLPYGTTADTVTVGNDARLPTTTEKAALPWAEANALTGGAAGALDALVTASTATAGGEEVIVTLGAAPNQTFSRYRFEKTGVAAESSPDVIRPDDFATDGQGNWNLVLYEGAAQTYGGEPTAVSSSTSGTAGTAETASRSDHGHDLSDHTHAATFGAQLTMPVAMSDYTAPSDWTPTIVWATATPESMTVTAKYMKVGKLVNWWLHIESADPGAGGGNITSIAFDANTQPADVGAGNIRWPVTGFHQKDAGAGDTWTDMQAWLNCTAAAAGDRLVTVKNPVVWADNEVTHLYLSGSHYTA